MKPSHGARPHDKNELCSQCGTRTDRDVQLKLVLLFSPDAINADARKKQASQTTAEYARESVQSKLANLGTGPGTYVKEYRSLPDTAQP